MEAIVFTKTAWPILSAEKYSMDEEAWKIAVEAQDRQRELAGAPVGTPSGCQLCSSPSYEIYLQTREAVGLEFCAMLFSQIYDIDSTPKYSYLKLKIFPIQGQLADGACGTVVRSCQLDLPSDTELRIQVRELLFDGAYLSKVVHDKNSWFT